MKFLSAVCSEFRSCVVTIDSHKLEPSREIKSCSRCWKFDLSRSKVKQKININYKRREFWRSFQNIRRSFDFSEIQWIFLSVNRTKFAAFSRLTWTFVFLKPWADLELLFMFVLVAFCVVNSANCIQYRANMDLTRQVDSRPFLVTEEPQSIRFFGRNWYLLLVSLTRELNHENLAFCRMLKLPALLMISPLNFPSP